MVDQFGFVEDKGGGIGFVPETASKPATEELGFQPEAGHLDFEANMQDEQKRKEQQAALIQQLKLQAEQAAQDPKNWTLKQTRDHFKDNPPKTPQEEAAMNLMIKQKQDQIDQMMNTELSAAPPPSLKQAIKETIGHFMQTVGLAKSPEEIQAHDQNINALSKVYDLPAKTVEKNYDAIAKQIFPRDPNFGELLTVLSVPPIAAGLALAPGATVLGLTGFQALSEVENAVVSKIKGEKYQFMRARGVADLLPEETSDASKGVVELLDMLGKGLVVGGVMQKAPVLAQRFTKDILTNYKLPEKIYLSTDKLQGMSEGQFRDYFQRDLNLSNQDLKAVIMARREGKPVQIELPAEQVTTFVDKPYWAKIKEVLNVKPIERTLKITPAGPVTAGPEVKALPGPESSVSPEVSASNKVPEEISFKPEAPAELLLTQPQAGGMVHKTPEQVQKMLDKGVTITERQNAIRIIDPEAQIKDISGKVVDLPQGHEMTPYKLSNGKIWLHDGKNVVLDSEELTKLANKNLVLGEKEQPKAGGISFDIGQEAENLYDKMPPEKQAEFGLEMDDLRKTPEGNLFVAIKQLGGIRPYESTGAQTGTKFLAEELKGIPAHLKNKNSAHTLDTIVPELKTYGWNFDSSDELLQVIKDQSAHPIEKASRAELRAIIREAEKNKKLQADILDSMKKRRKFIQTVKSADKTVPEVAQKIESRYEPITNEETLRQAKEYIDTDYNNAVELVEGPGRASTFSNAVAIALIDKAQTEGRFSDAIRLVEKTAEKNTELGQAIQALAMYERLTPEGILQYAEKQVRRARESIKQKERLTNYEKIAKTLENQADKDKLAEKLGIPHISEIVAGELKKMAEQIQTMPPGRDKQIEEALLLKKISDQIPPTLGRKIAMLQTLAQLLNPKTFIRNILGNVGFQVAENISDVFGTLLDISASLHTGKRTVYMPNIPSQVTGLGQGLKEGTQEALLGISLKSGTTQTKFSLPSNGVFNKGVLSALEKAMRVSLSATDRGFYQSAFNQSIRQQCAAAKVDDPTEEMIEKANYIGLYRTFNDDNMISDFFVRLKHLLNMQKDFGLGDIVIKYPRTPSNILARGIEYSPFGFIKTVFTLGRPLFRKGPFDQEEFVRSTSRAFTGSVLLVGAGALLATMGIISGRRAKDKDVAAAREQVGIREYQINTSALKRFIASGLDTDMAKLQEGDNLITYDWFLPGSIGLALGANMILNPKENLVDKTLNLGDQLLQASETLQQQPLISGLKTLTSRQNLAEGISEVIKEIPASFVPTALNQIRQLTDNTTRNTRDPNYFSEMYKKAIMRIPGISSTLPEKIDTLGRTKEMYQLDSNNPFNVLLNPAFVNKYTPDPVTKMVLDIWESTGQTGQFPRVAQTKIKLGPETKEPVELTPGQYAEYQKYIGHKTDVLFTLLANNRKFMTKPDDEKAKKLQGYLTDINTAAKVEILGYRPKRVSEDTVWIIKHIGRNKRQIEQNTKEDLSFTPEEDLGFVVEK